MNNQRIADGNSTPQRPFTNCPSSPAQGRSLREFEEQMAGLRKENFNLKLRIYFLEEKPSASSSMETSECVHKQNIDLKVSERLSGLFRAMPQFLILNSRSKRLRMKRCGKSSRKSKTCSVKRQRRWSWWSTNTRSRASSRKWLSTTWIIKSKRWQWVVNIQMDFFRIINVTLHCYVISSTRLKLSRRRWSRTIATTTRASLTSSERLTRRTLKRSRR